MKKYCIWLTFLFCLFGLGACQARPAPSDALSVTTSFYPLYIFTENIIKGAESIALKNMASPQTGCLHDYQLTTGDMQLLTQSDLFIINGQGMESFLDHALSVNPALTVIDTSKNAALLPSFAPHSHDGHSHEGLEEGSWNAHIWLSIPNAMEQVKTIADALSAHDPQQKDLYQKNAAEYLEKLQLLAENAPAVSETAVKVGIFHEGFDYFALPYHFIPEIALYADENTVPSAKALKEAADTIQEESVSCLFAADDSGRAFADALSRETGAKVYLLDPITEGPLSADAYEMKMLQNFQMLKEAIADADA